MSHDGIDLECFFFTDRIIWHFFRISSKKTAELIHSKKSEVASDLIGSFEVHVGDMDQVLHLWRITGGFEKIDTAARVLGNDKVWK